MKHKKEEKFMLEALKQAGFAREIDEVPVGCVIVKNDKIIARAFNKREKSQQVASHAEMNAIAKACKKLGSWRLEDCDIYITLEPCMMCVGAIIQSRIKNIYFGADDYKGGALGSSIDALEAKNINHHPNVYRGILKEECSSILTNYFKNKRK